MITADPERAFPEVLLCDADGCLFPSEEPAFEASALVTNAVLEGVGAGRRYEAEELRLQTTGKTFRTTITALLAAEGLVPRPGQLEDWVAAEREQVTAHLGAVLRPDPEVTEPLAHIAAEVRLAVVSSSALMRLDACFEVTGLAELLPASVRFSAEDSLRLPRSKPDPAVYVHALQTLGVPAASALAVEDSVPGAEAAVGAGIPTVGNLHFVAAGERAEREEGLRSAGVTAVVRSWAELGAWLSPGSERAGHAGAGAPTGR